ncbi:aldose epimerase family protein [Litchfieldella xinjiangensis]|uniref:aldose epimerase family protein n=1 Tax=Litchfieldella xinjiangensis TaxID=1166948 RepID=UPI0005BE4462|nr:aldose epimerase family protein [Halomonas xinjiangensis]
MTHTHKNTLRLTSGIGMVMLSLGVQPSLAEENDKTMERDAERIETTSFGQLPDGREVTAYRLVNANGIEMQVIDYGGIIVSLKTPDTAGEFDDIVLGFESLDAYLSDTYRDANPYFGALIGRYGNRIDKAQFELDGQTYELASNDGDNHLHGGERGFDKVLWDAEPFENADGAGLILSYTSEDGEEGYPGTLETRVTYILTDDDELVIDYHATTDKATPVNLTQHSYFNLDGEGSGTILDHYLMIDAEAFTPVDETLIPTGEIRAVEGTPFDFTEPTQIGERIEQDNTQLSRGKGYDHNFVLSRDGERDSPRLAARVWSPDSGRVLEVATTEPGLQFYSGNFLAGDLAGKRGEAYEKRSGFALETQHFPDSPNQSEFPSTILEPGETYRSQTIYSFSAQSSLDGND